MAVELQDRSALPSTASVAAVDDGDTVHVVPQPSSVVGEFDANFSNGSVTGGFGARK